MAASSDLEVGSTTLQDYLKGTMFLAGPRNRVAHWIFRTHGSIFFGRPTSITRQVA